MNQQRWQYLKALQPPAGRYLHVSCEAGMRPDKAGVMRPWVGPGTTYSIGRNAEKRARKALRKSWGLA